LFEDGQKRAFRRPLRTKYVIVIGSDYLSSSFIKWLETNEIEPKQVMAILDEHEEMGRKICGVQVLGSPFQLLPTVEEFAVHGVKIDEVIVSGGKNQLAEPVLADLLRVCRKKGLELTFLPELFHSTFRQAADAKIEPAELQQVPAFPISSYFGLKRVLDFAFALFFAVLLSPVFICVCALVALDVGTPLLFWQRRLGEAGRGFQMYKFRTMQSPFDRLGQSLPQTRRLSAIGHLLRKTGLDELPQLLNVLVGEMSLVGPRPLLPDDQPADPTIRLMVRPGITGWAQVNGGKLITNDEKGDLDEWYVRNASAWLDLRILFLTCRYVFVGNRANVSPSASVKSGVGEKTLDGKAA
jgi:lipopolysaccharide/colanic/teichoic acid biosynthesis glycosyltransferase